MDLLNNDNQYDLLIRGARVIDPANQVDAVTDVAVSKGLIVGVGAFDRAAAAHVLDARGLIISPGWIDLHAHVFAGFGQSGVDPDRDAGVMTGVTTVVDAGSSGAATWESFRKYVMETSKTNVLGFMNISLLRLAGPRHGDWRNFNQGTTISLAEREVAEGRCVGIKVLASQSHCGPLGIAPVQLARQAARLAGTRLMVHIGNAPPVIEDVLALLDDGDIVTHCWHGKYGGILGRDKKPLAETMDAVERGVKFDIGHGSSSFSFETARHALEAGLPLHAISTDLHRGNLSGPVFDLATTMTKLLHLGLALPEVVRLVTASPAQLIGHHDRLGTLRPGVVADMTIFRLVDGSFPITDSQGRVEVAQQRLQVVYTIRAGEVIQCPAHN